MISIIVPLFNEMDVVPELGCRIAAAAAAWRESFEAILVDDGSTDGTSGICRGLCESDNRFRLVVLSRNFGHQAALKAGMDHAAGRWIVLMDGDLQDPPETIGDLLGRLADGADVAYGIRRNRKEPLPLRASYALFYRILAATSELPVPLDAGDFCAMTRAVCDAIRTMPERPRFLRGQRAWVGFRQVGVEYDREARTKGTSKFGVFRLVGLAVDGILMSTDRPLRLLALTGAASLPVALATAPFLARSVSATRAALIVAAGFCLFGVGIVAAYIRLGFRDAVRRPDYVVRERFGFSPGAPLGAASSTDATIS